MAPKLYRRCICCQRLAPREEFWRVVRLHGDNNATNIQLDRGMGRSAYICPTAACLQQAQKKNRLGRSLRAPIPAEIWSQLESRLEAGTKKYISIT
ncbi:YlxR family protein [Pseudanabaena sp. PCC 6802]|uniref:YlxR family protein n=1 Tax=Pseudanabaena sp. PCC 6802 TaxID=118173 RepID=UPI0003815861|nr:YlxR family protein [Pseudanabaena sp. PCC 6802]